MNKYCWISFALVLSGHVGVSHQACDAKEIWKCATSQITDIFHIGHEESLENVCSELNVVLQCLKRCATGNPEADRFIFGGIERLINEMCTTHDSELAKDFMVHAKCIDGYQKDVLQCDEEYIKNIQYRPMFQFVEPAISAADDPVKKVCCGLYKNVDCITKLLKDGCGAAAATVVEKIMMLGGGPVAEELCPAYKAQCGAGTHLLPSLIFTLGATIIIMFCFFGFFN